MVLRTRIELVTLHIKNGPRHFFHPSTVVDVNACRRGAIIKRHVNMLVIHAICCMDENLGQRENEGESKSVDIYV